MNDSANPSTPETQDGVVTLATVRQREIHEIILRRKRALNRTERDFNRKEESEEEVQQSLIGLALSGGGVRSAAFSLGILQGLHRHGVLPFIDYLSTVSGGGYAGAFLSSAALHPQPTNPDGTETEALFPIADIDGKQSPRMLKFIHGGRYLRKTWVFINRYLVGLFLIWLVVLSGVMATATLVSYVFRMMDQPASSEWISALGFQDDLRRALFPSFVLFSSWAIFWGISYFKFGRYATGTVARFFFCLLIASLLVAFAALLGTGDIDLGGSSSNTRFDTGVKSLIFGGIVASLLPYLSPRRLIRSGTNPKNVGERYIFWLTTRALAYGVPFLFVAYFARENISHFNDYRDQRLVRTDIKQWEPDAPMWKPLVDGEPVKCGNVWARTFGFLTLSKVDWLKLRETPSAIGNDSIIGKIVELPLANAAESAAENGSVTAAANSAVTAAASGGGPITENENDPIKWEETQTQLATLIPQRVAKLSLQELQTLTQELTHMRGDADGPPDEILESLQLMVDIQIPQRLGTMLAASQVDSRKLKDPDGILDDRGAFKRPKQYADVSLFCRWWHFLAYLGEQVVGDGTEASENAFGEIVDARSTIRGAGNRIVQALNREIAKPRFYKTLLPSGVFEVKPDAEATLTTKYTRSEGVPAEPTNARLQGQGFKLDTAAAGTEQLTISEKIAAGTVSPDVSIAFDAVRNSHPDIGAEEWFATLTALRKKAESLAAAIEKRKSARKSKDEDLAEAAIAADTELRDTYAINHQLLQAYFGQAITNDRKTVYASIVLQEDQQTRWNWFVASSIVFLIASAVVDLNATSWHGFYSTRIASMWIEKTPGLPNGLPLAQLETTKVGRPYHLLTGAVHARRTHDGAEYMTRRDRFLFSKLFCGSQATGYVETAQYMDGEYTLEDAVAISGAAVSPIQTDNPLIVALLFLANIRLGQWVLNPSRESLLPKSMERLVLSIPFTPLRYLCNRLHSIEKRTFCFVTDGGHYENLGIETLLKRRCRLIIASDAGQDGDFDFADLTRLLRTAKLEDGISFVPLGHDQLPLELEKLVPDKETRLSSEHFVVDKIQYPDQTCGYLAYLKPTLTGDESFELRQFHRTQETFPHDPTSDQFYDATRFDAYRALGLHIVNELCKSLPNRNAGQGESESSAKFIERFVAGFNFRLETSDDATAAAPAARPSAEQVREILAELRLPDAAQHELARQKLERLGVAAFVAMPDLLRGFLDEHWSVKLCVQRLLYDHPCDALPRLVETIEQADDSQLQIAAADVIWEYGSGPYVLDLSSAIAPLVRLSAARQVAARVAAARTLAVIGKEDPEAKQALERCKADRSQKVRDACQV